MLGRPELIEEVFDDVMWVVWERAASFDGRGRVSTWLLGIAHRKALKALEKTRRHDRTAGDLAQLDQRVEGSRVHDEERALVGRAELRALARAIDALTPEQRAVVELTFFEGRSYAEIAEVVGCPVNTVKTRMFHARRQLQRACGWDTASW